MKDIAYPHIKPSLLTETIAPSSMTRISQSRAGILDGSTNVVIKGSQFHQVMGHNINVTVNVQGESNLEPSAYIPDCKRLSEHRHDHDSVPSWVEPGPQGANVDTTHESDVIAEGSNCNGQ